MQVRMCLRTRGINFPEGVDLLSVEALRPFGNDLVDAYDTINQIIDNNGMVVLKDANYDFDYNREDCQLIVQGTVKGMTGDFDGMFTEFNPRYQNLGYRSYIAIYNDGSIKEARLGM